MSQAPNIQPLRIGHGRYQTVFSDLPPFTFLGVPESRLPGMGLEVRKNAGRTLWVIGVPKSRGAEVELEGGRRSGRRVSEFHGEYQSSIRAPYFWAPSILIGNFK
jgi:hypothetical protein